MPTIPFFQSEFQTGQKEKAVIKKRFFPLAIVNWGAVVVLSFFGLVNAIYMALSHYWVYTDISYQSFCALSQAINCDTVSQSPYSIFLGLPVPVWGVIGYSLFILLLSFTGFKFPKKKRVWSLLFVLSAAFSLYSISLGFVSTYFIHSYCIMCILSYGINFSLTYLIWVNMQRLGQTNLWRGLINDGCFFWEQKRKATPVFIVFIVGTVLLICFFPSYWEYPLPENRNTLIWGTNEEGHPWIGAENPELTIEEFTDYQCFQCKKMHFFLRRLVAQHPDKIRLVHRNYPLDHELNPIVVPQPYHVGSGKMALVANAAGLSGKFWEMNDLLFGLVGQTDTMKIKDLAEGVGMAHEDLAKNMNNPKAHRLLLMDIREGMRANIMGTPAYRINGEIHLGQIPPDILRAVIQ
jgi:uncharacterized membrane protein/predicted DsbA family dithiol-disulfide isomerase